MKNEKHLAEKQNAGMVFNLSATKSLKRTIITSVTTLSAILIVYIVALVYNISSVQAFALPMIIGIISGCYSSICIAGSSLGTLAEKEKEQQKEIMRLL